MSENPESSNERPCLHCLIGDLIDEYYAEYGTATGETDVIDMDEAISALAVKRQAGRTVRWQGRG